MIDRDAFRHWLTEKAALRHNGRAPLGDMTSPAEHPLAVYWRETSGNPYAYIGRQVAFLGMNEWVLPEWALLFDRAFEARQSIHASEALAFFQKGD